MNTIEQLEQINKLIRDAEYNKEVNPIQNVIADDLLFRRANGTLINKTGYLTALTDKNNSYSQLEYLDIKTIFNEQKTKLLH